ncbi:MAG: hypothetical protein IT370_17050 [Deltaproteobacteria bacterium]|nr:hypothetical protein [Deltaproteobacteria bacterium]
MDNDNARAALLVALLTGCSYTPRGGEAGPSPGAAAAPAPSAPAPSGSLPTSAALVGFQFPAGDATDAVVVGQQGGQLVLDGHVTSVRWPGLPPRVFAVSAGRYLLYDTYGAYQIWLWEPSRARLTALGRALLRPLGRLAQVITPLDVPGQRLVLADVAPDAPALRVLYDRDDTGRAQVIGVRRGALVVAEPPASWQSVDITTLWSVRPGAEPTPEFTFLAGLRPVGGDALRGDRLLLYAWPSSAVLNGSAAEPPFTVRVAALDLASNQLRELGEAAGCWTRATAAPHPRVEITWASTAARVPADGCLWEVDDATEALRSR